MKAFQMPQNFPKLGEPDFEDHKLQYLNASARIGGMPVEKQRKAQDELDAKYPHIVDALTPKALPPKRRNSPPEAGSIHEAIASYGALAICLAALQELTDVEFEELGRAAAELHAERNPQAKLNEVEQIANRFADRVGVPVTAQGADDDDLHFIAEEPGAFQNNDGTLAKFAKGDTLRISETGFMTVQSYLPTDFATMKIPALMSAGLALGMPKELRSKAEVTKWFEERTAERALEIEAVPDEPSAKAE